VRRAPTRSRRADRARPHRERPRPLGHSMEGGPARLRHHLRRPYRPQHHQL